jgi:hypothetical protein
MITEALLMYLPAGTVAALAAEAWRENGIAHWISDITTTGFGKALKGDMPQSIRDVQASDSLPGEEILDRIRRQGWVTAARRSYITDMVFARERIQRMMAASPTPAAPPAFPPDDPTGVHRFARKLL